MVSRQTKKKHQSVPLPSQEAVKKKKIKKEVKDENKAKAKVGQIKHPQSKKNSKQDFSVKHSIKVRVRSTYPPKYKA